MTATVRLELFGAPRLVLDGEVRPLAWQRPSALIAYLACQPDWVSRDRLAAWLRPDEGEDSAKAYLRRLVHRLKVLGLDAGVEVEATRVRWCGDADVRALQAAVQARRWGDAVTLVRGPLLEGCGLLGDGAIDDYFEGERQRQRARWRAALTAHIDALLGPGGANAAPWLQRLAEDDTLDEDAVQFLLQRANDETTRRIALAAFDTLQQRLAYEMALRPLPVTQALADELRARVFGRTECAPGSGPLRADGVPFIGRDVELREVRLRLASGNRLLTLLGPGGAGKTALARRVLEQARGEGTAAAFVDLTEVERFDALLGALLAALGLAPGAGGGAQEDESRVAAALAAAPWLIVLDNAETLVTDTAALAALARWVEAGTATRWLVTSREPLNLAAEARLPVGGLPVGRAGDVDDAVALFVAHARRHGHAPTAAEAADIARIARAVDGLPLALELAAHWVPVMAPADIAAAIERDLGFLESDAPDRRPGHRSLRAIFDSSWARLGAAEQRTLAALTVCRGGFDRDAAQRVADADLARLLRLTGKSLVQRVGPARFRLHVQVAQFSADHLDETARRTAQRRHARHFLGALAARDDLELGTHAAAAIADTRDDLDNLRAAWRSAVADAQWDLLAAAIDRYEILLAQLRRHREAIDLMRTLAGAPQAPAPLRMRAQILLALALAGDSQLDAAAAALETVDPAALPPAHRADHANARALVASLRGDIPGASAACDAALAAARAAGDRRREAQALLNVTVTDWVAGRREQAGAHALQTLALADALGADLIRARAQRALSVLRKEQGRCGEAQQLLESSLRFFESIGETYDVAYTLRGLSFLMGERGDVGAQLDYAQRSLDAYRVLGLAVPIAQSEFALGFAQAASGDPIAAVASYRRCLRATQRIDLPSIALRALAELGLLAASTDRARALRLLDFVLHDPALRAADREALQRDWEGLRPDADEAAAARAANASATVAQLTAEELARE